MSAETPPAAGAEICWEPRSQGSGVGSTQVVLEGHMGKGRGMWEVLGTPSFPPPALSLSQRDMGTSSWSQTWPDILRRHSKSQICQARNLSA